VDLGIALPGDNGPGSGGAVGEDGGGSELGAGANINGSHSYATTTNYETGETTYVTSWAGELSGNADAFEGANASGTWKGTTSIAITRDANGQITAVEFVTQTEAGSTLKI